MRAVRRNQWMEIFWKFHRWIYRASRGRLLGKISGMPILLLTSLGRKSDRARTSPLIYLPAGEGYVVITSNAGEPKHPAWFLNLQANPHATVEVGARRIPVVGREATGQERARLWAEMVEHEPSYGEYQRRTERRIPVVVLKPDPQQDPELAD